ncbi:MAG TPA: M48 family metallopeptidase [Pyrinomonadaceae bacterium]|nr:M48 family metallopeptidase [Pyrinomonadaceae bacterium]
MFEQTHRPLLPCSLALALLLTTAPLAAHAGAKRPAPPPRQQKEEGKDKKKKEEKEQAKDDKPKVSKQEKKYQEIKKFSADLYGKDQEFRDEVDGAYRQKQREHSEYAYYTNTRNSADEQIMRDGDKLKVEDTLYDNPLAQDYVNRVGQSLAPAGTRRLYAFRITLNPIPEARSLSTGTVYVSTGLLAQIDNEAQLAYILGHEIAHVENDHWREDVLVERGLQEYNEKQQAKRRRIGMLTSIGLGALGVSGNAGAVAFYAEAYIMPNILKMAVPNAVVAWDKLQEDEADQLGLQYMLSRSYDVREVPKFYAGLQRTTQRDQRVGLGFMASAERVYERVQQVNVLIGGFGGSVSDKLLIGAANITALKANSQPAQEPKEAGPDSGKTLDPARDAANRATAAQRSISGQMSAELKAKLDSGELIGSTAEFEAVMAELKRDNGIRAFYYDMFQMARDNLEESLLIRSNDPYSHFYYGKVLKLTARNAAEKSRALAEFVRAIELDRRRVLPEARLHRALALIESKEPSQLPEIVSTLKEYVGLYQREHAGQLPPNMEVIYDYMQEAGELSWSAPPVMNISTKNIDPIGVSSGAVAQPRPAATDPAPQPAPAANNNKQPPRGGRRP